MYGAPGLGYQGHDEQVNKGATNLKAGTRKQATLIIPEYMCFIPTLKEKGKCEECDYRDIAKCKRNGWDWMERTVKKLRG